MNKIIFYNRKIILLYLFLYAIHTIVQTIWSLIFEQIRTI